MHSGKNLKDKHMNKSIDAFKPVLALALEALNRNDYLGWQTNIHVREAIKEALAQPAQEEIQRLSALVRAQQITIEKLEAQSESK